MDGRKVYVNNWLEVIIKDIKYNIENNKKYADLYQDRTYLRYVDRDERLLNKLDKYKKVDNEGHIYFYFFPNELDDLMWVMAENVEFLGGAEDELQ